MTNIKNLTGKISVPTFIKYITAFYMAGAIMQNIMAVKTFGTPNFAITAGGTSIAVFVFASMDIITEVSGKKTAIFTFSMAAVLNLLFNGICWIAIAIPGTDAFINECYTVILGTGWRITLGSIIAFWFGNYINASIMARMKSKDGENRFIFRAILSTVFGQIVDNLLFYMVAFSPIGIPGTIENPWSMIFQLVLCTTVIEIIVESSFTPITSRFVKFLKAKNN